MKWFTNPEEQLVEVAIGQVKGFFSPSDAERAAAYELLVELTTRPSSAQLSASDVSISEELASIEEMFALTRSILRKHGTESTKGSAGNLSLAVVALRVLNEVFRPVINRWRPLLDEYHAGRTDAGDPGTTPLDWELRWERAQQCRTDLNAMRASTRSYIETLSRIAGTPSVAEAVLSSPSSEMMRSTPIHRSRVPERLRDAERRERMVRWLHPVELWESALSMRPAKKSIKKAEQRDAVTTYDKDGLLQPTATFDKTNVTKGEEFWFDYVADMGDGFDGTAPVAWLMGRRSLHLPDRGASELPTPPANLPRGRLVVFGGDEVYPVAKPGRYEGYTELPFQMGLEGELAGGKGDAPTLIAIPGNHDWMGGIEEFERIFTSAQRPFAEHWKTVQRNNWWHVKLPQGWWLWGIDTGLDNTLVGTTKHGPGAQQQYFEQAAKLLQAGDRVVLCTPVPLWQLRRKHPESYAKLRGIFDPLIQNAGASMPLCLSGDTHAFAHLERVNTDDTEDHVMAGGGGAFLQPTHNLPERIPQERGNAEFKLMHRWPSPADSRSLAPGGKQVLRPEYWLFNVIFAAVFVGLAALVGWGNGRFAYRTSSSADDLNWSKTLAWSVGTGWVLAVVLALGVLGALAFVADSREPKLGKAARVYGLTAGLSVAATMLVVNTTRIVLGIGLTDSWPSWVWAALITAGTGIASTAVFFSLVKWSNTKIQANDTLALMPANSTRFKHFLRLRIDQQGDLTVYAVGIDPVGKGWYQALAREEGGATSVPPYDPAGAPKLHYVWGKTYRKFVPDPVNVVLSISDPAPRPDRDPDDLWSIDEADEWVQDAVRRTTRRLIEGGHTLMYGGVPLQGMTQWLHQLDRKVHDNDPNWEPHLRNYVAAPFWNKELDADQRLKHLKISAPPVESGDPTEQRFADLSAMRRLMTEHADVWLVVGGNPTPSAPKTRVSPGVLEEAYLAVEAGLPVVVIGGFGGIAGLIAGQLTGNLDHVEVAKTAEHFIAPDGGQPSFDDMLTRFSSVGVLRNGLTGGENRELLFSRDARTVETLVMRSVYRLSSTR